MNITYLFGAGASINAVPIVEQTQKSLLTMSEEIRKYADAYTPYKYQAEEYDIRKLGNELANELFGLAKASGYHASVDTYAKKLYLTDQDAFFKLKRLLSVYIVYQQWRNSPDNRYDALIASIVHVPTGVPDYNLPSNFGIITWNYDSQFEIAWSDYQRGGNPAVDRELSIYPKYTPGNDFRSDNDIDYWKFQIIKLNGVAGVLPKEVEKKLPQSFEPNKERIQHLQSDFFIRFYQDLKGLSPVDLRSFSFAFELMPPIVFFQNLDELLVKIETLVVVGYSFPQFNRQMDRRLIRNMTNLARIYYQDPSPQIEVLINSVLSKEQFAKHQGERLEIKAISDMSSMRAFFIPHEV